MKNYECKECKTELEYEQMRCFYGIRSKKEENREKVMVNLFKRDAPLSQKHPNEGKDLGESKNTGESKNLCKKGLMSVCTAKDSDERERCEFYEKSSIKNKCMYFIFDEYCDCLSAQMGAVGVVVKKEEEAKPDFSY